MTAATALSILSAILAIAKWWIGYSEQKKWIEIGAAQSAMKGIADVDALVANARKARETVRTEHLRNPDSIMQRDQNTRND